MFLEDYKPLSSMIALKDLRECDNFAVKKYSDSIYMGEVSKEGFREGKGIIAYKTGRVYEGHWFRDLREGKGYERYPNGNIFDGDYKKGKPHGKGIYKWVNGESYEGEWY
jgi:hypothetical protein